MGDGVIQPTQGLYKKPVMSVGTEFMAWAETYWSIKEKYNQTSDPQDKSETLSYEFVKQAFIKQIDLIISERIKHYL